MKKWARKGAEMARCKSERGSEMERKESTLMARKTFSYSDETERVCLRFL